MAAPLLSMDILNENAYRNSILIFYYLIFYFEITRFFRVNIII